MKKFGILFLCGLLTLLIARAAVYSADAKTVLADVERSVQRVRGLKQLHPVKAQFLADRQFDTAYDLAAHQDLPDTEVALSQREWVLLGLLKKTDDLHQILFQNFAAQAAAFYDYRAKVLYVRTHAPQILGVRRDLIAHEYVRALQDQHYHLVKLTPDQSQITYRNTDVVSAHRALLEGDAVNAQYLYVFRTYSRADLNEFLKLQSQPVKGPPLPKSIEREFEFQYNSGLALVQKLFLLGGMTAVDAAYRRLPRSTYEIMHPNAYVGKWKPVSVTLHSVNGFEGWKTTDDDVFGAFNYELLLWQFLPKQRADQILNAYRGDRYLFLESGTQPAMLFKSLWTTTKTATAARSAFIAALRARYRHASMFRGSGTAVIDPDGAVSFAIKGKRLTMAYAPTLALAQQLATAPTS